MFTPLIVDESAAALSREPAQAGQVAKTTARSTKARRWACIDSRSLLR